MLESEWNYGVIKENQTTKKSEVFFFIAFSLPFLNQQQMKSPSFLPCIISFNMFISPLKRRGAKDCNTHEYHSFIIQPNYKSLFQFEFKNLVCVCVCVCVFTPTEFFKWEIDEPIAIQNWYLFSLPSLVVAFLDCGSSDSFPSTTTSLQHALS